MNGLEDMQLIEDEGTKERAGYILRINSLVRVWISGCIEGNEQSVLTVADCFFEPPDFAIFPRTS